MKTFFMIKPDGVQRKLTGEIIKIVEEQDFTITKMKKMSISQEMAEIHYEEHKDKSFFNNLIQFITSGPVVAMELEGDEAVNKVRSLMGATNPSDAKPGTIRHKFGTELEKNVVHGSDSPESAERELNIFFG
jgi:nucleoside-diphosphate kinase